MREDIFQFYTENDGTFEYDKDLPYVVVNDRNELAGRFPNAFAAELFLDKALKRWGRIIETTVRDAIVGGWGYMDGEPFHIASYQKGVEAGKNRTDEVPNISVPQVRPEPVKDERPHSRACGIKRHEHGTECSENCPTCGGKNT